VARRKKGTLSDAQPGKGKRKMVKGKSADRGKGGAFNPKKERSQPDCIVGVEGTYFSRSENKTLEGLHL